MSEKPKFVMCICTGECPGFQSLNLWQLINYVRNELDVDYAIVHPQLCVDDGDRFLTDYIKPNSKYIIGACDPKMQRKMFKDAFASIGGDFDKQVGSLDLRNMSTKDAMNKMAETVKEARSCRLASAPTLTCPEAIDESERNSERTDTVVSTR